MFCPHCKSDNTVLVEELDEHECYLCDDCKRMFYVTYDNPFRYVITADAPTQNEPAFTPIPDRKDRHHARDFVSARKRAHR